MDIYHFVFTLCSSSFLKLYMTLPASVRQRIGHRIKSYDSLLGEVKSFIPTCTYRGWNCSSAR